MDLNTIGDWPSVSAVIIWLRSIIATFYLETNYLTFYFKCQWEKTKLHVFKLHVFKLHVFKLHVFNVTKCVRCDRIKSDYYNLLRNIS